MFQSTKTPPLFRLSPRGHISAAVKLNIQTKAAETKTTKHTQQTNNDRDVNKDSRTAQKTQTKQRGAQATLTRTSEHNITLTASRINQGDCRSCAMPVIADPPLRPNRCQLAAIGASLRPRVESHIHMCLHNGISRSRPPSLHYRGHPLAYNQPPSKELSLTLCVACAICRRHKPPLGELVQKLQPQVHRPLPKSGAAHP